MRRNRYFIKFTVSDLQYQTKFIYYLSTDVVKGKNHAIFYYEKYTCINLKSIVKQI